MIEETVLEEIKELNYNEGNRSAYRSILGFCLQNLGYEFEPTDGQFDHLKLKWIIEREEVVAVLREMCAEYGDNDWQDNLNLSDVIEKHLGIYLYQRKPGT